MQHTHVVKYEDSDFQFIKSEISISDSRSTVNEQLYSTF